MPAMGTTHNHPRQKPFVQASGMSAAHRPTTPAPNAAVAVQPYQYIAGARKPSAGSAKSRVWTVPGEDDAERRKHGEQRELTSDRDRIDTPRTPSRTRMRTSATLRRNSRTEAQDIVEDVADQIAPPYDEGENSGQRGARCSQVVGERPPPTHPIGRQQPESNRDEMLFEVEQTERREVASRSNCGRTSTRKYRYTIAPSAAATRYRTTIALANDADGTARKRPKKEPVGELAGVHVASV